MAFLIFFRIHDTIILAGKSNGLIFHSFSAPPHKSQNGEYTEKEGFSHEYRQQPGIRSRAHHLIDDEGTEHEFEIIDELENDDGYFMALVPTLRDAQSDVADADEYYIFEVVEDENGEEQLCEIEDDDLLDKLAEIFETRYAQAMEEEEEPSSSLPKIM